MSLKALLTILLCFVTSPLFGLGQVQQIVLDEGAEHVDASRLVYIFENPSETTSIDELLKIDFADAESGQWRFDGAYVGYSYVPVWARVTIKNLNSKIATWKLLNQSKYNPFVTYYVVSQEGKLLSRVDAGSSVSVSSFDIASLNAMVNLKLAYGETVHVYIQMYSNALLAFDMAVFSENGWNSWSHSNLLYYSVFLGVFAIILFQSLIWLSILKDKIYLFFILHIIPLALATLSNVGLGSVILREMGLGEYSFDPYVTMLVYLLSIPLTYRAISIDQVSKGLSTALKALFVLLSINFLFSLVDPQTAAIIGGFGSIVLVITTIFACALSIRAKIAHAKYYLTALILPTTVATVWWTLALVQQSSFTAKGLAVVGAVEMTLISLALNERVRGRLNGLLDSLKKHSENLESKVEQRTKELREQQAATMTATKFAALGEMAGGVAHEINNPLAIIKLHSIVLYKRLSLIKETKFEFRDEFEDGLTKITNTVDRIANIVKGMQTFARQSDSDTMQPTAVSELISDSLGLCQERFKLNAVDIQVVNHLPDLVVNCKPAEIVQVLINLLNNAYDACESLKKESRIQIFVEEKDNKAFISVENNGPTIDPEVLPKIFEPFFTTKPVGSGTGLGLGISQGIMEMHKGELYLDSEHPQTKFTLVLPATLQTES